MDFSHLTNWWGTTPNKSRGLGIVVVKAQAQHHKDAEMHEDEAIARLKRGDIAGLETLVHLHQTAALTRTPISPITWRRCAVRLRCRPCSIRHKRRC